MYADRLKITRSELPWLLAREDEAYVLTAEMLLARNQDDPLTGEPGTTLDWEFAYRDKGLLVPTSPPSLRIVNDATREVARRGFRCPTWPSAFFQHASPAEMRYWLPPVPHVLKDLGLPQRPAWPLVATHFLRELRSRISPLRETLFAEAVTDVAALWFQELRERSLVYRMRGDLPHLSLRIPIDVFGDGVPDASSPISFGAAREGLPLVPRDKVHPADIEGRHRNGLIRAILVSYAPESTCGFWLLRAIEGFPSVARSASRSPSRTSSSSGAAEAPTRAGASPPPETAAMGPSLPPVSVHQVSSWELTPRPPTPAATSPTSPRRAQPDAPSPLPGPGSPPAAPSQKSGPRASPAASREPSPMAGTAPQPPGSPEATASPSQASYVGAVPVADDEALWSALKTAQGPPWEPLASFGRVLAGLRSIRQEDSSVWAARTAPPDILRLAMINIHMHDTAIIRQALRALQGAPPREAYATLLSAVRATFGPLVGRLALDAEVARLREGDVGTPRAGASGPGMSTTTERARPRSSAGRGAPDGGERPSQRRRME